MLSWQAAKGGRLLVRHVLLALALSLGVFSAAAIGGPAAAVASATPAPTQGNLQLFATESGAQKHCPKDQVVWLNSASWIYHEKGMRWYGNTKHGAYVCRKEADGAGDRDTENGQ
jgi:hypothetical protein